MTGAYVVIALFAAVWVAFLWRRRTPEPPTSDSAHAHGAGGHVVRGQLTDDDNTLVTDSHGGGAEAGSDAGGGGDGGGGGD